MTLWQWLGEPAQPRWLYALLTGVLTGLLMTVTHPLWVGQGLFWIALVGGLSGGLGGTLAKLAMERGFKL